MDNKQCFLICFVFFFSIILVSFDMEGSMKNMQEQNKLMEFSIKAGHNPMCAKCAISPSSFTQSEFVSVCANQCTVPVEYKKE